MRASTYAGRSDDHFTGSVTQPTGQYAHHQPSLHLRNSDQAVVMFLDIDETRDLIEVLTANVDALQEADDRWAAERRAEREARERAKADAQSDGFLDNADPDMDAAGADDHLADVAL